MAELKLKTKTPKKQYSEKKTMNLAFHDSSINVKVLAPAMAVLVVATLLFAKFGFMDPLAEKTAALLSLSERSSQLALINAKLTDYDEVANEYGRYSYGWMTEEEAALVERMEVIAIVERNISPMGAIENFAVNGNVLSVTLDGPTLQETSHLVDQLESERLISKVSVYSAASEDESQRAKIAMTIILEKEEA